MKLFCLIANVITGRRKTNKVFREPTFKARRIVANSGRRIAVSFIALLIIGSTWKLNAETARQPISSDTFNCRLDPALTKIQTSEVISNFLRSSSLVLDVLNEIKRDKSGDSTIEAIKHNGRAMTNIKKAGMQIAYINENLGIGQKSSVYTATFSVSGAPHSIRCLFDYSKTELLEKLSVAGQQSESDQSNVAIGLDYILFYLKFESNHLVEIYLPMLDG